MGGCETASLIYFTESLEDSGGWLFAFGVSGVLFLVGIGGWKKGGCLLDGYGGGAELFFDPFL